jgi:hypothetical protein
MMVAVQATGSMRMSIGPFVSRPADQLVVVDDRADVGGVDVLRQFGGVVGVDDDDGLAGFDPVDDRGLVQAPARQHEGGLGVGLAQKDGFGVGSGDFVEVPGPDDGRAGAVGVGGFMAEDEGGHDGSLEAEIRFAALIDLGAGDVTGQGVAALRGLTGRQDRAIPRAP